MKITAGVVAFLVVTNAMGAYQYNWKGNQGWLTFDSTTTISAGLTVEGRNDKPGHDKPGHNDNYIDKGGSFDDYGWYNLDTGAHGSFNNGSLATFTEEDRIGLWVKDNTGDVYLSTKPGQSAPDNVFWGKSKEFYGGYSVAGGNFGSNGTHEYYVFRVNYGSSTPENAPSGQPLPGIAATLLVGGGALAYLKRRKNRQQVN